MDKTIEQLKVEVYDLIIAREKKQVEINQISKQINDLSAQISTMEKQ